jgi:hypothetical protein
MKLDGSQTDQSHCLLHRTMSCFTALGRSPQQGHGTFQQSAVQMNPTEVVEGKTQRFGFTDRLGKLHCQLLIPDGLIDLLEVKLTVGSAL